MIKDFETYIKEDYFSKLASRKDNGEKRLESNTMTLNYHGRRLTVYRDLFEGTAANSYSDDDLYFDAYKIYTDEVGNIVNVDTEITKIDNDIALFARDMDGYYIISHYDSDLDAAYKEYVESYYYKNLIASDSIDEKYRDVVKEVHDFEANLYKNGTLKEWILHIIAYYTQDLLGTDGSECQEGWFMNINLLDENSDDATYADLADLLGEDEDTVLTRETHPIVSVTLPTKFKLSNNLENDVFHKFIMDIKESIDDIFCKNGWVAYNYLEGEFCGPKYAIDQMKDYGPADGVMQDTETFYYTADF